MYKNTILKTQSKSKLTQKAKLFVQSVHDQAIRNNLRFNLRQRFLDLAW